MFLVISWSGWVSLEWVGLVWWVSGWWVSALVDSGGHIKCQKNLLKWFLRYFGELGDERKPTNQPIEPSASLLVENLLKANFCKMQDTWGKGLRLVAGCIFLWLAVLDLMWFESSSQLFSRSKWRWAACFDMIFGWDPTLIGFHVSAVDWPNNLH